MVNDWGGDNAALRRFVTDRAQAAAGEAATALKDWASEHGYSPLRKEDALKLIDELKARDVKTFEGLGIKVTL